jgi:hypothetical protein
MVLSDGGYLVDFFEDAAKYQKRLDGSSRRTATAQQAARRPVVQ